MNKVSEIVKDPEWQRVRQDLVGKWKSKPTYCCAQLKKYLGSIKTTPNVKLRIVLNYLTGTGFRTGRIKHNCISNLRLLIMLEIRRRKKEKIW